MVHAVDFCHPISACCALLLIWFELVEECRHTGVNGRDVFAALDSRDTLKQFFTAFRLASACNINPLFEIDTVSGLLNIAVPRTDMAGINTLR